MTLAPAIRAVLNEHAAAVASGAADVSQDALVQALVRLIDEREAALRRQISCGYARSRPTPEPQS